MIHIHHLYAAIHPVSDKRASRKPRSSEDIKKIRGPIGLRSLCVPRVLTSCPAGRDRL